MLTTFALIVLLVLGLGWRVHRTQPGELIPAVHRAWRDGRLIMLRIPLALAFASFAAALLPEAWVLASVGDGSGLAGILVATVLGAILPGGPFVAFPLAIGLAERGAGTAQLVALITAWSVIGINRVVVFELPMMGARFVVLRLVASASLPVLAGLAALVLADF